MSSPAVRYGPDHMGQVRYQARHGAWVGPRREFEAEAIDDARRYIAEKESSGDCPHLFENQPVSICVDILLRQVISSLE